MNSRCIKFTLLIVLSYSRTSLFKYLNISILKIVIPSSHTEIFRCLKRENEVFMLPVTVRHYKAISYKAVRCVTIMCYTVYHSRLGIASYDYVTQTHIKLPDCMMPWTQKIMIYQIGGYTSQVQTESSTRLGKLLMT